MGGIATITLNAALDRTFHVDRIEAGRVNTVRGEWVQAGGKGVNVSRVLRALGVETLAVAVVAGATGRAISRDLAQGGIPAELIEAPGESRTCLEIVEAGGRPTQLHGAGVDGGGDLIEAVIRTVETLPERFGWVAICGSLPPGMPTDAVRRLVLAASRSGRRAAIDTRGPALARAWAVSPDLVRVNDAELAEILPTGAGKTPPYPSLGPVARGVVSRGARPFDAWLGDGTRFRVTPPRVDVSNGIGCGDAMMAGLLAALEGGEPFEAAVRHATALATAEACSPVAGGVDLELGRTLENATEIERKLP